MEYIKAIRANYFDLTDFENQNVIKEQDNHTTLIVSFPTTSLCTSTGVQFYVLGVSQWISNFDNIIKKVDSFLIYQPTDRSIWTNFYNHSRDFDRGSLFVKKILPGGKIIESSSIGFLEDAQKYMDKYNIAPLFLGLVSQEQISEAHDKFNEELMEYL